jgi:hypothetical protein
MRVASDVLYAIRTVEHFCESDLAPVGRKRMVRAARRGMDAREFTKRADRVSPVAPLRVYRSCEWLK